MQIFDNKKSIFYYALFCMYSLISFTVTFNQDINQAVIALINISFVGNCPAFIIHSICIKNAPINDTKNVSTVEIKYLLVASFIV